MKTLRHAPLVELIVELRWGEAVQTANVPTPGMSFQINTGGPGQAPNVDDPLFEVFGEHCAEMGLPRSERLMPPHFPAMPGQVVYRYKGSTHKNNLVQIGPGIVSINALQPYESWEKFTPFLSSGVEGLVSSFRKTDRPVEIKQISVRTLNAFGPHFLKQHTPKDLIKLLGFTVSPTKTLKKIYDNDPASHTMLQQTLNLDDSRRITYTIGNGHANGEESVLFDIMYTANINANSEEEIFKTVEEAHVLLEMNFKEMCSEIEELLN